MPSDFDIAVAALRGKCAPKHFNGRKADATPEQWAAHLDYYAKYNSRNERYRKRNSAKIAVRGKEQWRDLRKSETPEEYHARLEYFRKYNHTPANKRRRRDLHLFSTYGINLAQYEAVHAALGGKCAICRRPCKSGKNLAVEHSHENGFYRGLTCTNCNTCAGLAEDSPELLRKIADYLEAGGTTAFDIVTFARCAQEEGYYAKPRRRRNGYRDAS
jgi:hypothetical protein